MRESPQLLIPIAHSEMSANTQRKQKRVWAIGAFAFLAICAGIALAVFLTQKKDSSATSSTSTDDVPGISSITVSEGTATSTTSSAAAKATIVEDLPWPPGVIPSSKCPCGHINSNTGERYLFGVDLDFTSLSSFDQQNWFQIIQKTNPSLTSPLTKQFEPSQVKVTAEGAVLSVQYSGGSGVKAAQLESVAQNIQFGTFRTTMKLPSQPGTCAAMFYYLNDLNEIDMEFLGSYAGNDRPTWFAGTQTGNPNQINNPRSWKTMPYSSFQTSSFVEYRFDWSPSQVNYYMNSNNVHTSTDGVPQNPGIMILNHWSTGAVGWEQGPPSAPVDLVIQRFKAYYNSSFVPKTCTPEVYNAYPPCPFT